MGIAVLKSAHQAKLDNALAISTLKGTWKKTHGLAIIGEANSSVIQLTSGLSRLNLGIDDLQKLYLLGVSETIDPNS